MVQTYVIVPSLLFIIVHQHCTLTTITPYKLYRYHDCKVEIILGPSLRRVVPRVVLRSMDLTKRARTSVHTASL